MGCNCYYPLPIFYFTLFMIFMAYLSEKFSVSKFILIPNPLI